MLESALLLSVRPEFAEKIIAGQKTVELRRIVPKVEPGQLVILYESSPTKAIIGYFKIKEIIIEKPSKLWRKVRYDAGVTKEQYLSYFEGSAFGVALVMKKFRTFKTPVPLEVLRLKLNGFQPPQGHLYLDHKKVKRIQALTVVKAS